MVPKQNDTTQSEVPCLGEQGGGGRRERKIKRRKNKNRLLGKEEDDEKMMMMTMMMRKDAPRSRSSLVTLSVSPPLPAKP